MKFNIGDKVKFLNEKGGGIISKILSNTMVHVAVDDGFDMPVMVKDLVLISNNSVGERYFAEHYEVENHKQAIQEAAAANQKTTENKNNQPFDIPEGIYIAFVPDDQKNLIIGNVEVYLLNNTGYDLIYSLFVRDKLKYFGIDYGNIEKYSEKSIEVFNREELEYFNSGAMQILFFKDSLAEMIPPINTDYKIKMLKLLKEDNFCVNNIFSSRAYIQKLFDAPVIFVKDAEPTPTPTKASEVQIKAEPLIRKHKVEDDFAEVDLHIEALCEHPETMGNHEKLQLQLDYFTRCLESAIAENLQRVVFIHGVGAGILKIELKKIFEHYTMLEYFDASIAKYGIGATEVLIHGKR